MTRSIPWRRRAPSLLLAALLHVVVIVVFVRGLALIGPSILDSTLQVRIINPALDPAPRPPALPAPRLKTAPPIPPLVDPPLLLPNVPVPPSSGDTPPDFVSGPLDTNAYYPLESALGLAATAGHVWTRVCIYSTGEIASVSLATSSGDKELDAAALTVARLTRWKPAMSQGKPVARCRPFRVDFSVSKAGSD